MYELLQNRFLFVEGGNDEHLFLEHYVLLGNFMNDPDRFEVFDALLLDFVREFVLADENAEELSKARKTYERLMEQARLLRSELARIEAGTGRGSRRAGERATIIPAHFPAQDRTVRQNRSELDELRRKSAALEKNLEELAPQIEAAKQRMDFLTEEYRNRLGDYLNEPANARRLFDAQRAGERRRSAAAETRARLLEEWVHRLEERDCSFTCSPATSCARSHAEYCPPIHLQQLKKALVSREEAKRVEADSGAVSGAQDFAEEAGRCLARHPPQQPRGDSRRGLQFAEDLMRLRRDRRNYQHVVAWMERINLVRSEHSRELSRANKSLYEFLHPRRRPARRRSR